MGKNIEEFGSGYTVFGKGNEEHLIYGVDLNHQLTPTFLIRDFHFPFNRGNFIFHLTEVIL